MCTNDYPVFGDCCSVIAPPGFFYYSEDPLLQDGVKLDCYSTYLNHDIQVQVDNKAFLVVSTCPHSWIESESNPIAEICTNSNTTAVLPPVTAIATGIVYRNEYCAICNGVSELVIWQTDLVCNPIVYELLFSNNISDIIDTIPDIIQRECRECSFQIPAISTTWTTPQTTTRDYTRSCIPRVNTCLSFIELEEFILGNESYTDVEQECMAGVLNLVRSTRNGVVYRNTACAICNNEEYTECFMIEETEGIPVQCRPDTSIVIEKTTTSSSTHIPFNETLFTITTTTMTTIAIPSSVTKNFVPIPDGLNFTFSKNISIPIPDELNFTFLENTSIPIPDELNFTPPINNFSFPENFTIPDPIIVEGPQGGPLIYFTITLRNLGGGRVSISNGRDGVSISLNCPEGEAPVGLECRPTLCPDGYMLTGGKCALISTTPTPSSNSTLGNCSTEILVLNKTDFIDLGNDTIMLIEDESVLMVMDYDEMGCPIICIRNVSGNTSDPDLTFLNCPTALVPLNQTEFTDLGNGTILYEGITAEVMFYDEHGRPLLCPNTITSTELSVHLLAALPGLQELTYIGCSLSILGTVMVLITYTLFSELRTLPGLILMNICITELAISLLFITGNPIIQKYPEKDLCSSLAITLHLFYLAQFVWTSIFSCEMVRNFYRARRNLSDSNKTKYQLYMAYFSIGWCLPLLVVTICIILNFSVDGLILYGVDSDGGIAGCWINHFESFIVAFLLPLVLSLSCNLLMFIITMFLLWSFRSKSTLDKSNTNTLIRVGLAVFSTTGLTWIFGFLAIPSRAKWVWYPFVIFNTTQGFNIFLAFLFTRKTLGLYHSLVKDRKKLHLPAFMNKKPIATSKKMSVETTL